MRRSLARRLLLICCLLPACHLRAGETATEAAVTETPSWASLPQPAREFIDTLLEANAVLEPELSRETARAAYLSLLAEARETLDGKDRNPRDPVERDERLARAGPCGRCGQD